MKRRSGSTPAGRARLACALLTSGLLAAAPGPVAAQGSRAPGAVEVGLLLRQLDGVKRVLLVAAHPDDEDTSLLASLARGWGAQTAYFALTRGEGGQNLIGPELEEGLGIVRTGELLSARALDGADQFFSRAYDFGYSKSAEETFRHWPRDTLLHDLVWVIRKLRPQVVVSVFSGTETDGHGQHQAAGLLAREAFDAAADPARFPQQLALGLEPWAPRKLYRRTLFDPEAAVVEIPTGRLDPLLGRSHHQLAMESRSQHRSQDFGTAQTAGPRTAGLLLLASRADVEADAPLFAGIDTTLAGLVDELPAAVRDAAGRAVASYRSEVRSAAGALSALAPESAAPPLGRALARLEEGLAAIAREGAAADELRDELARRRTLVERALLAAAGVRVELRARDDVLVPGQSVLVEARVWSGGPFTVEAGPPRFVPPDGWRLEVRPAEGDLPPDDLGMFARFFSSTDREASTEPGSRTRIDPGELVVWRYRVGLPRSARPTLPYYLETARTGATYRWPDDAPSLWGEPFAPAPLAMTAVLTLAGEGLESITVRTSGPVRFRGVDKASGEFWRPVQIAPRLSVRPSAATLVWPTSDTAPREITVTLRSEDPAEVRGSLALETPEGWTAEPASVPFSLGTEGRVGRFRFVVRPAGKTPDGDYALRATARTEDGELFSRDVSVIEHPHIEPRLFAREAVIRALRFPVRVAERRIGYVMGSGDDGPDAIRQLGLAVEPIEPGDWRRDRLDRFDLIVLGVRAYEVRPDLVAANAVLLEWVRDGGTLLVQYNKYEFNERAYAPYPIRIGPPAPRVTDETAPVRLRDPGSPALAAPNRIGEADFAGWVQERGLYFPTEWDDAYAAPLETADAGEPPRLGSLLIAPYGEGLYLHTSLSFFRQLPAGVPGAYRLFANLLSLDPVRWREAAADVSP